MSEDSDTLHTLQAAIDYAFVVRDRGYDGLVWLDEWRQGDAGAMAELDRWRAEP